MKKLLTLLTILSLSCTLLCISGCEDSGDSVYVDEGRLVSDVVINTSMDVFKGMEVPIEGQGFESGDQMMLRAETDLEATTEVSSSNLLTFTLPDEIEDGHTYKFVLLRGDDYQVLGASTLTVKLVINVELDETMSASWGAPAVIRGEGFRMTDVLVLDQAGGSHEITPSEVDDQSVTFIIPEGVAEGESTFTLRRGEETQELGTTELFLSTSAVVPDKEGMTIKGIVHSNGQGIPNVLVSDGDLITQTDENGFYWLASEKRNQLAFIILPSGYDVPTQKAMPQFWKPCTLDASTCEQLDFKLIPTQNDNHTMLVATDMHLANRNTPLDHVQFADGFVSEITANYNSFAGKVYMLNLGDFSWDLYWYSNKWALPECKAAIEDFNFQVWSAMGNHDNDPYVADDFLAEAPYRQYMGPVYYAMNIGKIHYIMLDDTQYTNDGGSQGVVGDREYNRTFTAKQLAWLREELKYVDKSTPIVVGAHCPLYNYSGIDRVTTAVTNVSEVLSCFEGFKNVTFVTGHTHVNRNIQSPSFSNVYEQNVAAVCGTWWWTRNYAGINICTDGSPAGYKIYTVNGTNMKWQYKGVDLPVERQFMTYDMNEVKNYWATDEEAQKAFDSGNLPNRRNDYNSVGENEVFINVWANEPGWDITVTENDRQLDVEQVWMRDPLHTISYDIPRGVSNSLTFPSGYCPHIFSVTASSANSTLEISVTDRFGNVYTESMTRPKAFKSDF